jgi:hypothetical protein
MILWECALTRVLTRYTVVLTRVNGVETQTG